MTAIIGLTRLITNLVPEILIDLILIFLFLCIPAYLVIQLLPFYLGWKSRKGIRRKWNTSPNGIVILHATPRGTNIPNISPFTIKLETFLRMAKIPYEFDDQFPFGSKRKTPWITFNGQHLTDSQLIIEFLKKKFDVELGNYGDTERAIATTVRIMVDEYLYWHGVSWRFVHSDPNFLKHLYSPLYKKYGFLMRELIWKSVVSKMRNYAMAQGSGRHSYEEMVSLMENAMLALSKILGDKKFLLGDEPCEDDAAVFGLLAQGLYSSPGAPVHDVFKRCPNLVEYTDRMRKIFWPDWDDLISKT